MNANLIVTNNPHVIELYHSSNFASHYELLQVTGDTLEVLTQVRHLCHSGAKLLTHPLSGSIKPNQTPYKTVVLAKGKAVDIDSVLSAEDSWYKANSLHAFTPSPAVLEHVREDLGLIDFNLFKSYLLTVEPR